MATAAGSTHTTGMHSCSISILRAVKTCTSCKASLNCPTNDLT